MSVIVCCVVVGFFAILAARVPSSAPHGKSPPRAVPVAFDEFAGCDVFTCCGACAAYGVHNPACKEAP